MNVGRKIMIKGKKSYVKTVNDLSSNTHLKRSISVDTVVKALCLLCVKKTRMDKIQASKIKTKLLTKMKLMF